MGCDLEKMITKSSKNGNENRQNFCEKYRRSLQVELCRELCRCKLLEASSPYISRDCGQNNFADANFSHLQTSPPLQALYLKTLKDMRGVRANPLI